MNSYEFLIANGEGAASRGMSNDTYYTIMIEAENDKEAYKQLVAEIYNFEDFDEWFFDYCGVENYKELDEEGKEWYDNFDGKEFLDSLDISGGDPWIEGMKVNGVMKVKPNLENMFEYGFIISPQTSERWFGRDINDDFVDDGLLFDEEDLIQYLLEEIKDPNVKVQFRDVKELADRIMEVAHAEAMENDQEYEIEDLDIGEMCDADDTGRMGELYLKLLGIVEEKDGEDDF